MQVPLVDLKRQLEGEPGARVEQAINRVIASGAYASGSEVPAFESEWAAYCGAKFCIGLSSCSDALYLCIRFAGTHGMSHVATTPVSFWATTEAALRARMVVDYVDIDETGCMAKPIENGYTINLPVDLYGMPNRTGGLRIEDCAQSHGLKWKAENNLLARCYSFYPTKNLGAMGMAGAVVTDSEELYEWLKVMRSHGEKGGRFVHEEPSGNWRMDEMQAAVLRAKLPFLDEWTKRRRSIARDYIGGLGPMLIAGQVEGFRLPVYNKEHVWHIFPIFTERANELITYLGKSGVMTGKRYPVPLHFQRPMQLRGYKQGDFPAAEKWCKEVVNLPIFETMRDDEVAYVTEQIAEFFRCRVGTGGFFK